MVSTGTLAFFLIIGCKLDILCNKITEAPDDTIFHLGVGQMDPFIRAEAW